MRVAVSLWPIRKTTRTKTRTTTSVRVASLIVTLLVVVLSLFVNRVRAAAAADDDQQQQSRQKNQIIGKNLQAKLSRELEQQLLRSLLKNNTSQFANELISFQTDLVRKRNAQCLFEKNKRFEWSSVVFEKYNVSHFYSLLNNQSVPNSPPPEFASFLDELNKKCYDVSSLFELFPFSSDSSANNKDEYSDMLLRVVLNQLNNEGCDMCQEVEVASTISQRETWIYGIIFVSLINLSSLCGVFIIPLSNRKFYKKTLMFLIAIAVGSLAGSGFLHLIPQAFGITEDTKYSTNHEYVWKGVVMMGGVYLFYVVERVMKIIIQRKKLLKKKKIEEDDVVQNEQATAYFNSQMLESIGYVKTYEANLEPNLEMRIRNLMNMQNEAPKSQHGHSHSVGDLYSVAPVAWMIIFGDGLHNFIDGLSIGAAFTESIIKGISICLAVICEEFPHELGDFAILINAGMSYPVALFFNFLSACCCYAGLVVGITLGENFGANEWIYAIAGGMFLYISLCDMIPELNEMGDEIERDHLNELNAKAMAAASSSSSSKTVNNNNKNSSSSGSLRNKKSNNNDNEDEESRKALRADETAAVTSQQAGSGGGDGVVATTTTKVVTQNLPSLGFKIKILVIQNIGILFGFSFMLFMAIYSEAITL